MLETMTGMQILQVGLLQLFVSSRKTFLEVQIKQAAQSNGGSISSYQ